MKIVAVRVPENLKGKMKEVHVDWSDYLRHAIEERVAKEKRNIIVKKLEGILKGTPRPPRGFSVKSIREDRNSG